jgi:hypothetical protein
MSDKKEKLKNRIVVLEHHIYCADKAIAPKCEELAACRQELLELDAPFKVGQTITWGRQGLRGRIIRVYDFCGRAAYKVTTIRKDGSEGEVRKVWQDAKLSNL